MERSYIPRTALTKCKRTKLQNEVAAIDIPGSGGMGNASSKVLVELWPTAATGSSVSHSGCVLTTAHDDSINVMMMNNSFARCSLL
jgi:hypothetical protein